MIDFTIQGNPKPQKRPRFVNRGKFVTVYDASKKDKADFLRECMPYAPPEPFETATSVEFIFAFSRPRSHYRSGKFSDKLKPSAPEFHIQKSDIDNLIKTGMDALNGVFWKDDSIIDEVIANKRWTTSEGYTSIKITEPEDNIN